MRELPPEVWNRIISLLKRDVIPPWHGGVHMSDEYHQHDLTVMWRLSTTFHELVIPHLYTSVVITDMSTFFQHIDDTSAPINAKITSKAGRLRQVRYMRFMGFGPDIEARWSMRKLLSTGSFDLISPDAGEAWASAVRKHYTDMINICQTIHPKKILPNVEKVVLGHRADMGWRAADRHMTHIFGSNIPGTQYRLPFLGFIEALQPRRICTYAAFGPYALTSSMTTHMHPEVVISTHDPSVYGYSLPKVIFGAFHRHYVPPGLLYNYDGPTRMGWFDLANDRAMAFSANYLRGLQNPEDSEVEVERTRIVVYGLARPLWPVLGKSAREMTMKEREYARKVFILQDEAEREGIRRLEEWFGRIVAAAPWKKDLLVFKKADEMPRCEACGWRLT